MKSKHPPQQTGALQPLSAIESKSFALLVPTLNAGVAWNDWIRGFLGQNLRPTLVLVLDSDSQDDTVFFAKQAGFIVKTIARQDFSHGATRQLGLELIGSSVDFLVCMTQDAELATPDAITHLLQAFEDPAVGATYGRQLPAHDALPLATHARLFNYPAVSHTVHPGDQATVGFKACFLSNSFAAYRVADLRAVGGFPGNVILGEDTSVAARLLLAGKSIRYQADACVYHSHNYTPLEEFRRYFDIGVFHARERWLLDAFGGAGGEGFRFVTSELRFLLRKAPWLIPSALLRTACKLAGYRLGRAEARLPVSLKRRLSMFRAYWS